MTERLARALNIGPALAQLLVNRGVQHPEEAKVFLAAGLSGLHDPETLPGALDADTLRLGQALADVATIGLLQARAIHQRDTIAEQLQSALNSRVIIEQAKGVIAERRQVDMEQSFALLRSTARTSNRRLSDLARAIVDRSETL